MSSADEIMAYERLYGDLIFEVPHYCVRIEQDKPLALAMTVTEVMERMRRFPTFTTAEEDRHARETAKFFKPLIDRAWKVMTDMGLTKETDHYCEFCCRWVVLKEHCCTHVGGI